MYKVFPIILKIFVVLSIFMSCYAVGKEYIDLKVSPQLDLLAQGTFVEEVNIGQSAFIDSDEKLAYFPLQLQGRKFLKGKKAGIKVVCQTSGFLTAVVPVESPQLKVLFEIGFQRLDFPEFQAFNGKKEIRVVALQKLVQKQEELNIDGWVIYIFGVADRGGIAYDRLTSLDPKVLLPDGTEFKIWEINTPEFTKTYYVDQKNTNASDENPGTPKKPFKTISKAAQVLKPGERVVVASGIYRECVTPFRGGTSPDKMISYIADPGQEVVIKGSELIKPNWYKCQRRQKPDPNCPWDLNREVPGEGVQNQEKIWTTKLKRKLFIGYNPFAVFNIPQYMMVYLNAPEMNGWFKLDWEKLKIYTQYRGMIFQDDKRLKQVSRYIWLFTAGPGHFWVEPDGLTIHVWPYEDKVPEESEWEFTTREQIFAPDKYGLGYIQVKGFVMEHAANGFPVPQHGAISTMTGHHWIIEDNTIRWVNGVGMDIGKHSWLTEFPDMFGQHIVRNNTITDCGICGICGYGGPDFGILIEKNKLHRNAWHNVEEIAETASIKTHRNHNSLIRKNIITDTLNGSGMWLDFDNVNSRFCQNMIINTNAWGGGILLEASIYPNYIDRNIIWNSHGVGGNGIFEWNCRNQIIAHNFIGKVKGAGICLNMGEREVRQRSNRGGGEHKVINNIIFDASKPIWQKNESAGNTILGNITEEIQAEMNDSVLSINVDYMPQGFISLNWMTENFFDLPLSKNHYTGPFGSISEVNLICR